MSAGHERKPSEGVLLREEGKEGSLRTSEASSEGTEEEQEKTLFRKQDFLPRALKVLKKYASFVGPGFVVAVAYVDPGNYATDVAAGATFDYKLLFIVLMSTLIAVFLQVLCIKLGSVTGLNLSQNCKAHLPPWLNCILWIIAEIAIIATDMSEVIGTAIALNILLHIPLPAGCALSVVDVLIILIFYSPTGTMRALRVFEGFVALLVLGVIVCFCFELSKIQASVGEVFHGFVPSATLIEPQALYQACGILGATVMPHSLYLGSGIVQPRLREYDDAHNSTTITSGDTDTNTGGNAVYRPSLAAIKSCMSYSIAELVTSLLIISLFVNAAILIVAGASLTNDAEAANADLFSIHALLSQSIAPAAGTLFALALLLSGASAGIVCTITGQMVSEGQIKWNVKPWQRHLFRRAISVTPSIIIAAVVGRPGISAALEGSQVALSVILPIVTAPLIWFTCNARYMEVEAGAGEKKVQMRNHWGTTALAVLIWGVMVVMNVAALVFSGRGYS